MRMCRRYCCANKCDPKSYKRLDRLIRNGENRYYKELDIVNVLNTIRLFKVFFYRKFPAHQRILLQMQRSQVIESNSEDDHDQIWDRDQFYLRYIYNDDDPIKRVLGLAYISR